MSLKDCIDTAVAAGEMDAGRGQQAKDLFDELEADLRGKIGPSEAGRQAAAETARIMRVEMNEKNRRNLLQAATARRVIRDIDGYRNSKGEPDPANGLAALIDKDQSAQYSSVEAHKEVIRGRLHARLDEFLVTFKRDVVGRVRNKATLHNLVREAFGEDSGDVMARQLNKAWAETAEFARLRFNAAGGRIAKRENWGLPQHHDTMLVRKAGFEAWRSEVLPRLDLERMIDERTGRAFNKNSIDLALREVYDTISTDGFSKVSPSGQPTGRSLANRHTDHRFLVFKDGDNWLQYQEKFGSGDPFSVMMAHLDTMSRDIAFLEVLGPNPTATLQFAIQSVQKRAAQLDANGATTKHMDRAGRKIKLTNDMFANLSGRANAPIDGNIGNTFAGLRSLLQSAQLGSAAISAITDLHFQRLAAQHAGLPQTKTMKRLVSLLNPANTEDRKLAVRLGLIAEHWSSVAYGQARYVGEISGPEISRRLADFTMRVSGLSPWTQAGRWAFGMEFLGTLADLAGKPFDQLNAPLQKTMTRYGIGQQSWDIMRATELYEHEGASFLRPEDIAGRTDLAPGLADDLTTKLMEMVQSETEFAVPSSSLRGRVIGTGDNRPGTIPGELLRSGLMYKNFAITLMFTHGRRMLEQATLSKKGLYAAQFMAGATLMGGLSIQMHDIAKGRDPRPMMEDGKPSMKFWGAALMQGGGLGIYGDFFFSGANRFGGGLNETFAGPVVGFASDMQGLIFGNMMDLASGKETNAGRDVVNMLRRYTPGGSLWYARAGWERMALDWLQEQADPKAHRAFQRMERRYERERNQTFWWRPGQRGPDRAPDLSNALGD